MSEAAGFDAAPFAAPDHRVAKHFRVDAGGETLVFCYIRKNASSAFKALAIELSPARARLGDYASGYDFLRARHRAASLTAATRAVLAVRDPVERLVSTFRNKFVQRIGAAGIFASYRDVAGAEPEAARFEDFVLRYLLAPGARLDPHVAPQVAHLLPARYTEATPLAGLHDVMAGIVGPELAARHFAAPVNATRTFDGAPGAEVGMETRAWIRPSGELHAAFLRDGRLPAPAALLAPHLVEAAAAFYAADAALLRAVEAHRGARAQAAP